MPFKVKMNLFQLFPIITSLNLLMISVSATRMYERRSDLEYVKPISATNWTVPLVVDSQSLPPPTNRTLTALAIGRGNVTWDCSTNPSEGIPIKVLETAYLYDIAPLVQVITSVGELNGFVGSFVNFDYSQIDNSTLQCIGTMRSTSATKQCYDMYSLGNIEINVTLSIGGLAPFEDLPWTFGINNGWKVYIVETVGGHGPTDCTGQEGVINVPFAAEFWFYH